MVRAPALTRRRDPGRSGDRFPRSARVNEVLREVLAEALERLADTDDRLALLTITGIETDPDFRRAKVLFASLGDEGRDALEEARVRLQAVVASQARLKWTPQLSFAADPVIATGQRVEDLLRRLHSPEDTDGHDPT
jgi:ribosome-binding factor A